MESLEFRDSIKTNHASAENSFQHKHAKSINNSDHPHDTRQGGGSSSSRDNARGFGATHGGQMESLEFRDSIKTNHASAENHEKIHFNINTRNRSKQRR